MFYSFRVRCFPPLYYKEKKIEMFLQISYKVFSLSGFINSNVFFAYFHTIFSTRA